MTTIELTPNDSINEALSSAPEGPITLVFGEGTWNEKVCVNRPNVTFLSEKGAVISFSDHHGMEKDGRLYNTSDSATVTISAPSFFALGITFVNSFNWPEGLKWNEEHDETEKRDLQAVAVKLSFGATKSVFRSCSFVGWQDTLYIDYGSSFFEDCSISGCVDFIFGAGSALFQGCEIISRAKGCITAPSTFIDEKIGFIFHDSTFKREQCVVDESVYLSRPWFPSGSTNRSPMTLFIDCEFDGHINLALWTDMTSKRPDGTTVTRTKDDARFFITSADRENISAEKADEILSIMLSRS